ncbi:cytochrome P450 [Cyathus striatus]|nr:cytochrome P450 [Cyathus striatus]
MGTFFLAMLTSTDTWIKVQKEIDQVIGSRLPGYEDWELLPYVEAVYREVMRWNPVVPLNVAYLVKTEDADAIVGTIIIPNIWAMVHDDSIYPDPNEFKPKQFFMENGQLNDDISDLPFGFGRGRHMASATVWLTIATVLTVFNIRKAKDDHGNKIPVSGMYTDMTISHPEPFQCSIMPRSDAVIELINSANYGIQTTHLFTSRTPSSQ